MKLIIGYIAWGLTIAFFGLLAILLTPFGLVIACGAWFWDTSKQLLQSGGDYVRDAMDDVADRVKYGAPDPQPNRPDTIDLREMGDDSY